MMPPTEIIQDIGFDASSSRRQNSGSSWPMRRTSRISLALLAMVLFGTPVSALRSAPVRWGRCARSNKEVHATNGVDRRRCPNAKVDAHERRGALACQLGDQLSDEFGVLGVEVLATERVGELEELLDVMPERGDPKRFVFVHLGHEDALRGAVPTEHLVVIMSLYPAAQWGLLRISVGVRKMCC